MFGGTSGQPLNEDSLLQPEVRTRRESFRLLDDEELSEAYGLHAVNGILFNHESPVEERRLSPEDHNGGRSHTGRKQKKLYLGNLDAKRDWGYAPEYMGSVADTSTGETG